MADNDQQDEVNEPKENSRTGDVPIFDLVPCCGFCCCIFSCFTEFPECFGSVCENVICCIGCKILTCKGTKEGGSICKICSSDCVCMSFKVCCSARGQFFCLDSRVSLPPTPDIPCLATLCCLTMCYNYNCVCTCAKNVREMHYQVDGKVSTEDGESKVLWVELFDRRTGYKYYMNQQTGQTRWDPPPI